MVMPLATASRRSRLIALRWRELRRGEEIVEAAVILVVPMELLIGPLQEAVARQQFPFGFACECHVHGRGFRRLAKPNETSRQSAADFVLIDVVADQEARAGRRRKGNRGLQFRIIAAARAFIGIRPAAVEHVLALRMRFQIAGHDAGDHAVAAGDQMPWTPAGARDRRSGRLDGREKSVRNKGVVGASRAVGRAFSRNRRIGADIPFLSRNLADGRNRFEGNFG